MSNTNEMSIEELKAALQAKEDALAEERRQVAEQEREIKRAAEKAQREAEEAARKLTYEETAKAIVTALKEVGFKNALYSMENSGEFPIVKAFASAGQWDAWSIKFEKVYGSHSHYFHSSSFDVKVIVGDYGHKHSFPVLKAGGYNYAKIAKAAFDAYQAGNIEAKRQAVVANNQKSNEVRIANLKETLGKPAYKGSTTINIPNVSLHHYNFYNGGGRGGQHSEYHYRTDNDLMLHIEHITEENAAKLIKFMIANGMTNTETK